VYPNWFVQNWTIPRLGCAYGPSWGYDASLNLCRYPAAYNESRVCSIFNPVDPADGAKRQVETDIEFLVAGTRLTFERALFTESLSATFASEFGYGWTVEPWGRAVRFRPNSTSPQLIRLWRKGRTITLANVGSGIWRNSPYGGLELKSTASGWLLTDQAEGSLELYDGEGRLVSLQRRNGLAFNVAYSAGLLTSVSTPLAALFSLSHAQGKIAGLTASGGRQLSYSFDASNPELLRVVTYPDERTSSYVYEPERAPLMTIPSVAALVAQLQPAAYLPEGIYSGAHSALAVAQRVTGRASRFPVTGIVDELGNRFATYAYDAQGRAILSEHAGVERYQFSYPTAHTQTVVTDPLGTQRTYNFVKTAETLRQTLQSQAAGSGCGPSSSAVTYDTQANVSSRTDFNNNKVCYAYDLSRNLETKRAEGLTGSAVCSTALSSPPTGARIISTQWHPDWRLETRIAEPKKLTTITYNGQGATCAPSTVLVDGKPPAVICTRTEQATTDETGAAGFAATVTGTARTWRYTYTTYGRVLAATDPNSRVTTTTYHPDNDPDLGKRGNVASITNAANHTTYITDYNPHGQPTRIVDPNGVVTVLTYDPRLRLASRTVGNEATVFGYDPVGQMTSVDLPDGARLTYTYDAAHRLTAINDHKGNVIEYTLDAMGNRRVEQMKDPGGALVQNISRAIDALNRVQQVTGAVQ
jgi:YD repeat-containing protein